MVVGNHTALHGVEKIGGFTLSDTVVVQGSGPIGIGAQTQAKLAGAERVIMIGAPANRLALAKEMGADETIDITQIREPEARVARVMELTGGEGADMVIECSGAPSAFQEGLEMVGARRQVPRHRAVDRLRPPAHQSIAGYPQGHTRGGASSRPSPATSSGQFRRCTPW